MSRKRKKSFPEIKRESFSRKRTDPFEKEIRSFRERERILSRSFRERKNKSFRDPYCERKKMILSTKTKHPFEKEKGSFRARERIRSRSFRERKKISFRDPDSLVYYCKHVANSPSLEGTGIHQHQHHNPHRDHNHQFVSSSRSSSRSVAS